MKRQQLGQFVEQFDKVVPGIDDNVLKKVLIDESINKLKVFDDHSDDLGVIFKVEEHVIDELNQKGLNLCVFVVEVVMHIYFELFRSDIAFIKT